MGHAGLFLVWLRTIVMRMLVRVSVIVVVIVTVAVIVAMIVAVVMVVLHQRERTHCAPSPFMSTFSSSESELRIAVVLSSRIFL